MLAGVPVQAEAVAKLATTVRAEDADDLAESARDRLPRANSQPEPWKEFDPKDGFLNTVCHCNGSSGGLDTQSGSPLGETR